MSARQYPRKAWVLLPSFKPKEVIIASPYHSFAGEMAWDVADSGKLYHVDNLFATEAEAISNGRDQVKKLEADIAKRQATLTKRIAALDRAAMSAGDAKGASDE